MNTKQTDAELRAVLESLIPGPTVWNVASVADEPELRLISWSIRQDTTGARYFVGVRADDYTGRVSTRIVEFDPETRRGRTASGRIYELLGPPGVDREAEYVWDRVVFLNGIIEVRAERPEQG